MILAESMIIVVLSTYCGLDAAPNTGRDAEPSLKVFPVDVLDRIFSDMEPGPMKYTEPVHVPRGGNAAFQFAVTARESGLCEISVSSIRHSDGAELACSTKLFHLLPVPVEDNAHPFGQRRPYPAKPPAEWMPLFVREAPFDVAEVLVYTDRFELRKDFYHGVLVDVAVSTDAQPGECTGRLKLKLSGESIETPFSFVVHNTVVTGYALDSSHWFWVEPKWLTTGELPEVWSEAHWKLIENSARTLREYGQSTILTPLFGAFGDSDAGASAAYPLIQTHITLNGRYAFDFTRFERWVELFLSMGFEIIEGMHFSGREGISIQNVYAYDERTGETAQIFKGSLKESKDDPDAAVWLNYLTDFMDALYAKLSERGWISNYKQHLADEPYPEVAENYKLYRTLLEEHMPGVESIEADWSEPALFSPYMDIQIMAPYTLAANQEVVLERKKVNRPTWQYDLNCAPPFPGRHLDRRLATSRVQSWLAYLYNSDGCLNWAGNLYRGDVDPYETSFGPYSYPPGETWKFYPGPDGIRGSMRALAFRDGLLDHALLSKLAEKDRQKADEITKSIAQSITSYEEEPGAYHTARKAILTALD